jgi:hypothetical protein
VTEDIGEIRDDAINVLEDAKDWNLPADRWARVTTILDELETRTGSGIDLDDPELRRVVKDATMRMERLGPRRIEPVDKSAKQAPPAVVERLNITIDKLHGGDKKGGGSSGGKR